MTSDVDGDDAPPSLLRYFGHLIAWSVVLTFALISLLLIPVAISDLIDEGGMTNFLVLAICLIVGGVGSAVAWRWRPDFTMGEPNTPRGNRIRWLLVAVVGVGLAISFPLIVGMGPRGATQILFSNDAVPPVAASISLAVWIIAIPLLALAGQKNADEHAMAAHNSALKAGFSVFYYVTPIWWMGWRGGFLPEPDAMIIFAAILIVVTVVNLVKRAQ